ncbi:hypothetical protein GQ54DRAFT_331941 [Martensiomyces pterosporus]|nr:hypothetical protein GQ54DRAFT_331941 [Martensiomyces pterosporus]
MLVYNLLPRILVGMLLYIKLAYTSELGAQRSAGEGSSINAGGANRSFNQDAGSGARNQQFAVALLSKLLAYTSTGSNSDVGEVALNDIGFTDSAARVRVKDLYGVLDIALSEKYKYRFTPAAASAKENNMLSIPFSDVFTLTNESIKYISRVLEMLSTASRAQARNLAPLFGIDATGLSSPAAIHSVARLLGAISTMHPESLSQVAEAGNMEHDDPAAINKSLFTLGDLLNINSQRVSGVSGLFKSISKLSPGNLLGYLYDVGWERDITSAAQTGRREAKGIPSFNYMFPLSDQVLSDMALAAQRYEDGDKTEAVQLRPLVQDYLKQADSLWSLIPGLSSVSSLVDVGSSPLISAITQLIALSYKYPNASYQDLLLLYYQSIGMPGLSQLTEYPSQYIGGLASSIVGGLIFLITIIISHNFSALLLAMGISLSYYTECTNSANTIYLYLHFANANIASFSLAVLFGLSAAAPSGLNIPGILSLDIGGSSGLELDVLNGLVHAEIGGHRPKSTVKLPAAVPTIKTP